MEPDIHPVWVPCYCSRIRRLKITITVPRVQYQAIHILPGQLYQNHSFAESKKFIYELFFFIIHNQMLANNKDLSGGTDRTSSFRNEKSSPRSLKRNMYAASCLTSSNRPRRPSSGILS